jgi:hypothetical protein
LEVGSPHFSIKNLKNLTKTKIILETALKEKVKKLRSIGSATAF